jgi:hypothetical protein
MEWSFSQVKGSLDDDITEGKSSMLCLENNIHDIDVSP